MRKYTMHNIIDIELEQKKKTRREERNSRLCMSCAAHNDFELLLGVILPILLAIRSKRARKPLLLGRLEAPPGHCGQM